MVTVPAMMSAAATWTTSVAGQPALLWRGQQSIELLPVHTKTRAGHGGAAGVPTAVVRGRSDKTLQHPFADFVQLPYSFCRRHMLGMAAPQVFVPPACAAGAQALLDGAAAVSGHDMPCRLQPLDVRFLPEQCSICQGLSR